MRTVEAVDEARAYAENAQRDKYAGLFVKRVMPGVKSEGAKCQRCGEPCRNKWCLKCLPVVKREQGIAWNAKKRAQRAKARGGT